MTADSDAHAATRPHRPTVGARLAERLLKRVIRSVTVGRLTVVTPEGGRLWNEPSARGRDAVIVLHSWRALTALFAKGEIGFAEAYIAGHWSTPDLAELLWLADENGEAIRSAAPGSWLASTIRRLFHATHRNSRRGSRRNIAFHYDLGNEFYRLWLDPSMSYSSALYFGDEQSLEIAQETKLARIADHLEVRPGQRVLEIGCGWGTLARRLADAGAEVSAVTLSREQFDHACEAAASDARPAQFLFRDYRDLEGQYDRIVSIEMLEAVGERYWPVYFAKLRDLLSPGGRVVLQVITIAEDRFAQYRRQPDFIQRYVFPGGMLPTPSRIALEAEKAGLRLAQAEHFGGSYALTLAEWRRRFGASWPQIERLGFGEEFRRLWEYYLAYCETGFRTGATDVGLYVLEK
ncbi:class I SAM-dependent methyltransferase [Ancylobacter terrae]|uniref:class I SAM-dependent methyltransferase n=1 Tax=Ancylobacter sp. sgz301288 TaxID=3342077 RepID=UPI00385EF8E6